MPGGGNARDPPRRQKVNRQHDQRPGHRRNPHQANAAHLKQPGDGLGGAGDQAEFGAAEIHLIVGHQAAAAIDEAQRQIGFSRRRGAAQQHGAAAQLDAGSVDTAHGVQGYFHSPAPSGRQTDAQPRAEDTAFGADAVFGFDDAAEAFDDLTGNG